MFNKKTLACVAAFAATCALALCLAGCGGSQAASSSAASSSAASSPAASASASSAAAAASASASSAAASESAAASSAAASASAAAASASAAASQPAASASSASQYIGEEAAKAAALKHAGLAAGDVTELKAELDLDDAVVHYDVEFKSGGMEYDYDIDAKTGDVLTSKSEVDD